MIKKYGKSKEGGVSFLHQENLILRKGDATCEDAYY
jgi:hypothetical protein